VVGDNVDRSSGTFKIMSPFLESLEDGQEFFIMSVVIKFRGSKGMGMESHRVDFSIRERNGEDCGNWQTIQSYVTLIVLWLCYLQYLPPWTL
jgi:hypothetical protein